MYKNKEDAYETYIKVALDESYYMTCLKVCIKDYSTPLMGLIYYIYIPIALKRCALPSASTDRTTSCNRTRKTSRPGTTHS
jgi:hypothetical protein